MAFQWKFLADLKGNPGDVSLYGPAWAPTRNVPANADLNTFRTPGIHRITTPDTATILNLPPGTRVASELENVTPGTGTDSIFTQRVTEVGESARKLWRSAFTSGGTFTPWALDGVSGAPVTEWHVFLAVGQSNMSGRGIVSAASGGKYMQSRIAQFGFVNRVVETATVPLDMHDTASGLSPASVFANNYVRTQPDNVGVLIVAAAHGGTGFTTSTAGNTWSPNVATNPIYDLPQIAVDQTEDAITAASATGATVTLKGILWHQGENNSSMAQATYAANLDGLIAYFRAELVDAKLPFIVGQMAPEGITANAGRENIDAAHQDTPNRVPFTGFAAATAGGHNPGDTTHMSKFGLDFLGRTYLEAYEQIKVAEPALAAVPGAVAAYIAEDPTVIQAAADLAANNAGLLPKWKPNTPYTTDQQVATPAGDIVTRLSPGTSGATYTSTNWAPSSNASGLATKLDASVAATTYAAKSVETSKLDTAVASVTYAAKTAMGVKVVPLQLTLGNATQTDGALTGTYRYPMKWNAQLGRVRVCIQNVHPSSGTVKTGAVDFTGLWVGKQGTNGAFTAAPTQVVSAFSTPADGSVYRSKPFDLGQVPGVGDLLSLGYTAANGTVFNVNGAGWKNTDPAQAGVQSPTLTSEGMLPFYIWLEAEVPEATPHFGVMGDSLASGVGAAHVQNSWLSQYCYTNGALPTHYSNSGDTLESWATNPSHYKWKVFDGLAIPDALIIAGGSNDLNGVKTNVEIQGYFGTVANLFRAKGITNLYAANIMPRTSGESGTFEVNRQAHNTWLTGLPNGVRELYNFRDVVSVDDETLIPAYDYDGVHLNAAGYAALAASISKLVITGTNATRKVKQFKNVREYKLAGAADDSAAITAAHLANGVVYYPDGDYTPGAVHNTYDTTNYTNAIGPRWQAGRSGSSTPDARPVFWAQKHSSANRATLATEYDNGAGYFALIKDSGDAYGAGLTGYARHGSTGGGQIVGVHGRAYAPVVQAEVWGGSSYVSNATDVVAASMTGYEVNVVNKAADQGWQAAPTTGRTTGLAITPTDGSNPITHGIFIGSSATASSGKMHTGLLFKSDSIVTSGANTNTAVNDNEAIRIEGASGSGTQYTGIRFRSGTLATGISFKETGFSNNCAILMGDDQRIVVGPGPAASTYFSLNRTTLLANINGMSLAISGTKVLGARETGWGAATGTVDKAAWTTYTAATVSATYVQAEVQAIANAVQANSRHLAAIQQALTTHGMIGA